MRFVKTSLVLAAALAAMPLSAQTWQAIGVPSRAGVGPYWNQPSDDSRGGEVCHIGAILTNVPVPPTNCDNQAPRVLPLTPAPLTPANVFLGGLGGSNPGAFR